jgi:hypothetical protein
MISEKKIVNVASFGRIESLIKTVESIIDQCDELNIVLNSELSEIPTIFFEKKINLIFSDNSYGDAMKFYFLENSDGYYITIDDDIIYPPNYVDFMISRCKDYNNSRVITLHGRTFGKFPISSYYRSANERYSCFDTLRNNVIVQFGGTGVMCFHTDLFKLPIEYFRFPNMADVWIGKYCMENKIEILCVRHDEGYVRYINQHNTIFDTESNRDYLQTLVTNSIFDKTIVLPTITNNENNRSLEDIFKVRETPIKIASTMEKTDKTINYEKINQIFNTSPTHVPVKTKNITGNSTLKTNASMVNRLTMKNKRR